MLCSVIYFVFPCYESGAYKNNIVYHFFSETVYKRLKILSLVATINYIMLAIQFIILERATLYTFCIYIKVCESGFNNNYGCFENI